MPPRTWPDSEPPEIRLTAGSAALVVDLRGGGMRALTVGDWDVLDGYPSGTVIEGWPGAVLLPWPNRIRDGRWTWEGHDLQLEVGSAEAPHAIHGLVAWQPWTVLTATDGPGETSTATVGTVVEPHPGYPFRLAAALDYRMAADRLTVTVRVRNDGTEPAPFGVGMHPYLSVGGPGTVTSAPPTCASPYAPSSSWTAVCPPGGAAPSTERSAGSATAPSTTPTPTWCATTTAGRGRG